MILSMFKTIKRRFFKVWRKATRNAQERRGHVVITGTGRAGTTYLVHLLTALGFDTGYKLETIQSSIDDNAKAGLEIDVRSSDAPFICKSPWFSEYAAEALSTVKIQHIIIPVRDFHDAAESRKRVTISHQEATGSENTQGIDGGLVFTDKLGDQLQHLYEQFARLIVTVADYDVPVTFVHFPRFASDPEYLYKKLSFLLEKVKYQDFLKAYSEVTRRDYIHSFSKVKTA